MTQNKQIKFGMVGGSIYALIGEVHRKAINFDPRAEMVCGCFSNIEQENIDTAEVYGIPKDRMYVDYKEMALAESSRPDGIDFVSICTPNFLHYEVAKAFLEAGIHVVCEKPLCFNVKEAEELQALAKQKDLVFGVTYTYTGYPMVKVAKQMIAEGKIGEIATVSAEYLQDWLLDKLQHTNKADDKDPSIWRTDPKFSGISNCVGDIGTHTENIVHYVTGLEIKRLLATVNRYGYALDLNANMIVEFENGINGSYMCSQVASGKHNGLAIRIYGSEGSLEWEQHTPDFLKYTPKGQPTQILNRGCGYIPEEAGKSARLPGGHPEGFYIAFANIYRNIISTIIKKKAGETPSAQDLDFQSVEDGLKGVKFVAAVIESADHDSKWIDMK